MARIQSPQRKSSTDAGQALVGQLAAALRGEEQAEGPVVFEIAQGESGYFQVVIIWERWADLPNGVRDQIVNAAYRELGNDSPDGIDVDKISMILPVTAEQAIDLHLLPYAVRSNIPDDRPEFEQLLPFLKEEGAIQTGTRFELRLPTQEMAQAAFDRLKLRTKDLFPDIHWSLFEQVGRIYDYN